MKDWGDYIKASNPETTGKKPTVWGYLIIKAIDNSLVIAMVVFTLFFSAIGLFMLNKGDDTKLNFALHASELCLGVLLGLMKNLKK
jgi:hypothetical protein